MSDRKRSRRKGHRYTAKEKEHLLREAERLGVPKAAKRHGVSAWSFYRWRREADERRASTAAGTGAGAGNGAGERGEVNPLRTVKAGRIDVPESVQKQVVGIWRHNPGFGPSQIRNQLRRVGVRCDTKTVRKILLRHGYVPPAVRPPRPREDRRFEATRPLELVQMDVLHFHVHSQRVYLFLALDDHSRFIVGWDLLQRESMEAAITVVEGSIRRYGKPEAVLTDRGATFHSWSGIGAFDRFLESYNIEHRLADPHHPQTCGKVEAVNRSIQKELLRRVEFRNFLDAKAQIAEWVDTHNHQRTHQGIGGVLVPADRFFGRADRVLERIESGLRKPVPPALETRDDERDVSLFQIRLHDGMIELWLFGRRVLRLKDEEEA